MKLEKEIIIYTSLPFKKYRWVCFYSIIQVGLLSTFIMMMPTPKLLEQRKQLMLKLEKEEKERKKKERGDIVDNDSSAGNIKTFKNSPESTAWERFKGLNFGEIFSVETIKDNISERPYVTFGLTATCIATTTLFYLYIRRQAHILTLLPKDRLRFTSFSPTGFGRPPSFEIPLKDVSCVMDRKSKTNFSILKFRNRWLYFLVNKKDGLFIEPKLYDQYLAYERSWAKKRGE